MSGPGPERLPAGYAIRELRLEDAAALAEAYRRNRDHLARWDPPRTPWFYTEAGQRASVADRLRVVAAGADRAWVLTHGDLVVGRVNLSNAVMGPFRSVSLGYWVDGAHLRKGLAVAGVEHALAQARKVGLHRVEASTLVHNTASQAVLARCGFTQYGRAEKYLFIDGAWREHNLYQRILHDDPL